ERACPRGDQVVCPPTQTNNSPTLPRAMTRVEDEPGPRIIDMPLNGCAGEMQRSEGITILEPKRRIHLGMLDGERPVRSCMQPVVISGFEQMQDLVTCRVRRTRVSGGKQTEHVSE